MTRAGASVLVAIGLCAVAACGDDALPPPVTVFAPTTTDRPRPTTTVPTTAIDDTAPPSATDPPGSDPAASSTVASVPISADEAEVRVAFDAVWSAYFGCMDAPASCDPGTVNLPGTSVDAAMRDLLDRMVSEGQRAVAGSGPLGYAVVGVTFSDADTAVVRACLTDGLHLVDEGDPAEPADDVVVDDGLTSYLRDWVFERSDGVWRRTAVTDISVHEDATTCDG